MEETGGRGREATDVSACSVRSRQGGVIVGGLHLRTAYYGLFLGEHMGCNDER